MDNKKLNIVSIILLTISIGFNFMKWYYDYTIFGYTIYTQEINIKPSLITTLISLLLFGGFIIRNFVDILNDNLKIIIYVLDLIFFSGFIAMFANGNTNILGFSSQSVLFVTVILMYAGMRSILRYILLVFIACSFLFLSKVNEVMGFFGCIYILCAFFSFVIQIYTDILPKVSFKDNEYFAENKKNKKEIEDDNDGYKQLMEII